MAATTATVACRASWWRGTGERHGCNERPDAWPGGAPEVGQRSSLSREVRPAYIALFSEISGDDNPVHYDEAVAAASPFGEIIVQGGVTSSI
jgi:acyl dehydratase